MVRNIHGSLTDGGLLYSSQPGVEKTRIEVCHQGETAFVDELDEAYFGYYLDISRQALFSAVDAGLFTIEDEATWQSVVEFGSTAAWLEDRLSDSDDDDELKQMAADIDERFPDGIDSLRQVRQDWYLLLKKRNDGA